MALARDSKGRFLPGGVAGGDSAADDLAGITDALGVTGTAATETAGVLDSLGITGSSAARSITAGFSGIGPVTEGLAGIFKNAGDGLDWLGEKGVVSAESIGDLKDGLGKASEMLGPYAAAVDTAIAVTSKFIDVLWDLGKAAVSLTQEKDALRETFDAFTGGGGNALLDGLEDLASGLPFTADKLNAWAQSLLAAGIKGDELNGSIQAIAASAALMPKNAGVAAEGLIKRFAMLAESGQKVKLDRRILAQLGEAGVLIEGLAKALGVPAEKLGGMSIEADRLGAAMQSALVAKAGPALARMGDTWTSISAKLKEGWDDAFEDLGDIVGPFMSQLRGLASAFFAGSIASGVLKDGVKGLLTPAFEIATRIVRAAHIAVLQIEIAWLRASIALRPLTTALDKLGLSAKAVDVVMYLVTGTAITLAVVFGLLAVAVFAALLPFFLTAAVIALVVYGITYLIGVIGDLIANFDQVSAAIQNWAVSAIASLLGLSTGAKSAAADFVAGFVDGITGGGDLVSAAVGALADRALGAFTGRFQIRSPSRLMKHHGRDNIAGAATEGVEEGTPDFERAMAEMASPSLRAGQRAGRAARGALARLAEKIEINFYGRASEFDDFREQAEDWLEKMAAEGPEQEPA